MAAIFVVLTILVLLGVDALVSRRRNQLVPVNAGPIDPPTPEPSLPAGLFLHPGHAWVEVLRSGAVRVGLDEFLRHVMGAPDRLVMRRAGDEVRQGEPLLTLVRDGRQLVLRAPVSGTFDAVNEELEARPQTLARSVYGPS
jgi:glycine cleavage system H lipoate-binding protein